MAGHVKIGAGCIVAGKAGVTKDIPPGHYVSGFPAIPHDENMKIQAHIARLPELKKKIADLEARLAALERRKG